MSKSKGKVLTVSAIEEEGYNPLSYRFMVLQSHYRKQLAFSYENLSGAENAYKKLKRQVLNLKDNEEIDNSVKEEFINKFKEYLSDDLNTANSITLIYEVLKSNTTETTKKEIIKEFDKVLSLDLTKEDKKEIDESYINEMINKRNDAKKNKDFALADSIRSDLEKEGIILKDTREGTTYEVR